MIQIIRLDRSLYGIKSGFSTVVRAECKATPGMWWNDPEKAWCGYPDAVDATAKRLKARGLNVQGKVSNEIGIPTMPVADKGLRDYQKKGVEFLIAKAEEGAILADDLGLGKTNQAITAARALKQRTVVVCPAFVRGVWEAELPKWWKDAKVVGLRGTKPNEALAASSTPDGYPVEDFDVVLIHYDILYAWVDILIAWGPKTLIVDEGDYLMSGKSRRTQATQKLAAVCAYRMMLAGTPMNSKIIDLWAPVETISPGRFGKFFAFAIRHAAAHQEQIEIRVEGVKTTRNVWKFDGSSNLEELNERLKFFMLRRLKSEVALELPARTRQIITLEVDRKFSSSIPSVLKSDKLLRQALNSAADGKFPQVIDYTEDHLKKGAKVVVGTYRRAIADVIADGVRQKGPYRVEVITGETPIDKRRKIIVSKPDLLCCTLDSTRAGINLSYANVGMIAELVWVPSTIIQWENRFGRFQGMNILIQIFVARGTADDLVKAVVLKKLDKFANAIGRNDDKLHEDLRGLEGNSAAERMAKLYRRLKEQDE